MLKHSLTNLPKKEEEMKPEKQKPLPYSQDLLKVSALLSVAKL